MSSFVKPNIYISAVEKSPAIVKPNVYVAAIEKSPAFFKPNLYISAISKNPAVIAPHIYISAIDIREEITADTLRIIDNGDIATADTLRRVLESVTAKTLRQIVRSNFAIADTIIRHPHNLIFTPAVNTFKDYHITDFSVTLNERTLSDTFNFDSAIELNINDAVKGQLLDYPFNFLVEETNQRDLVQSVKGMFDIDKLLYSQIFEAGSVVDGENVNASVYIERLAKYFSLSADIKFEDFAPYQKIGDTNITYADLISTLFSWTSRLPQRQINVFIRGDTLHCIQRGFEADTFDISNLPHSRPNINRKFIRTMYINPNADDNYSVEDVQVPFSGTMHYSDIYSSNSITYSNGLLINETSRTHNNKVDASISTTYDYFQKYQNGIAIYYLKSKYTLASTIQDDSVEVIRAGSVNPDNATKVITSTHTNYIYSDSEDGVYLFKEYETTEKQEFSRGDISWQLDDTSVEDRQTFHTPVGNGWYSTAVYVNGEHQGSSISQGKPSNEVSLYTMSKSIIKNHYSDNNDYDSRRSRLAAIADISFPVYDLDMIRRLTDDLLWLNRKTQETVTLDLIPEVINGLPTINHIVDFTERVILNGSEYFLVSNQINLTPNSFIQKLTLVRWF